MAAPSTGFGTRRGRTTAYGRETGPNTRTTLPSRPPPARWTSEPSEGNSSPEARTVTRPFGVNATTVPAAGDDPRPGVRAKLYKVFSERI